MIVVNSKLRIEGHNVSFIAFQLTFYRPGQCLYVVASNTLMTFLIFTPILCVDLNCYFMQIFCLIIASAWFFLFLSFVI